MKNTTIITLAAMLLGSAGAIADTAVTDPAGFVTITINGADANGGGTPISKLTAFTVTLRDSNDGGGKIESFGSHQVSAQSSQVVDVVDAAWTVNQWTVNGPHLAYIAKTDGTEQAFLILGNTAAALNLATDFDLTGRFSTTDSVRIVKAPTFGTVFGTDGGGLKSNLNPNAADSVYVWDAAAGWSQYYHDGTKWSRLAPYLANANNVVIYPDEGLFVFRKEVGDVKLVLTGSVPTLKQITDIPSGSTFVSARYPVGTVLKDMGFQSLSGWVSNLNPNAADSVYYWNVANQQWTQFYHNGTNWVRLSPFLANADDVAIPGNAAVFISRQAGGASNSGNVHTVPYDLSAE